MLFTLDTPTEAKLTSLTPRTEHHGDDLVSALTLGLSITAANIILDGLSPGLRQALYERADDATDPLDGIEPATTKLRTKLLGVLSLALPEIVGGTLFVEWGTGDDMAFGDCKAGKWRVECFDGGTVTLGFKVSTSDVSDEESGHLFGKLGQVIMIRFAPPAVEPERVETGLTIDGTSGHSGASLFDAPEDATDAFVEQHAAGNAKAEAA